MGENKGNYGELGPTHSISTHRLANLIREFLLQCAKGLLRHLPIPDD